MMAAYNASANVIEASIGVSAMKIGAGSIMAA